MRNVFRKRKGWVLPVLGCILFFGGAHVLGPELPFWPGVALTAAGLAALMSCVLILGLLNRIAGWTVLLAILALAGGTLLMGETGSTNPELVSKLAAKRFDVAWKALYGHDWFPGFCLHDHLMRGVAGLSRFGAYRATRIALSGLLGIALGICFLFPVDPADRRKYGRVVLLLIAVAGLFSLQLELLRLFSPLGRMTLSGVMEGLAGSSGGLALFALANWACTHRKRPPKDRRFNVLGVGIEAVDMGACLALFEEIIGLETTSGHDRVYTLSSKRATRLPAMTTAMGVAGIVRSRRQPRLQRILNESVLNTPDGMPLVWLGRWFGYQNVERVYGPDLLREVCAHGVGKGWRHFFFGAAPGTGEKLKKKLEERYPSIKIPGVFCPPFRPLTEQEEAELVETVNRANVDIFWIGISTPRQIYFMDRIRDRLNCRIICPVGYAFDVNAEVETDAPDWIKYSGFQWLHRAIRQPRLWKRYLSDNPAFVLKIIGQLLRIRRFPMFSHERPQTPRRDAEGYPRFPAGTVDLSALSLKQACDRVAHWIDTRQHRYVNLCTADTVVQCNDRPDLANIVMNSGMAATDGMPLVWLARLSGVRHATRVYGPDLMMEMCALSEKRGYAHYFYGASGEVLEKLRARLLERFPMVRIAGMHAPPFRDLDESEKKEIAGRINAVRPDIVWCGLGTPKQDYWVADFRPRLDCAAVLAVGAAFNFHAGRIRQAPRWVMRLGLEWLFRLGVEPRRLWRRYLLGNPRFVGQVFGQVLRAGLTGGYRAAWRRLHLCTPHGEKSSGMAGWRRPDGADQASPTSV